jgi:hypothetical protein
MKNAMWVLWPSFIAGAIGTVLLFALLDPVDLRFVGPLELGRKAGYTLAFFFFWALAAGCYPARRSAGRRSEPPPLTPEERPLGCPKQEEPDAAR